jgi:geranylgeranyl transferase type-2 subunit beta
MIDAIEFIDKDALRQFILSSQDPNGGIADRPDHFPDIFHTLFGLGGLALLGFDGLKRISPVYCLPL